MHSCLYVSLYGCCVGGTLMCGRGVSSKLYFVRGAVVFSCRLFLREEFSNWLSPWALMHEFIHVTTALSLSPVALPSRRFCRTSSGFCASKSCSCCEYRRSELSLPWPSLRQSSPMQAVITNAGCQCIPQNLHRCREEVSAGVMPGFPGSAAGMNSCIMWV